MSFFVRLFVLSLCSCCWLSAKSSQWTDHEGKRFKGEPSEIIGVNAVFRVAGGGGKQVPWPAFSDEELLRFARERPDATGPAEQWGEARGRVSKVLRAHLLALRDNELRPISVEALPEPELFLFLYGSHHDGPSWQMVQNMGPTVRRLNEVFAGRIATVFVGLRHKATENLNLARAGNAPWYVLDLDAYASAEDVLRFAPAEGNRLLLMTRQGVPLVVGEAPDREGLLQFVDTLTRWVAQLAENNARVWEQRARWGRIGRQADPTVASLPPQWVGLPFRSEMLVRQGVTRVRATCALDAAGRVGEVVFDEDGRALRPAVQKALVRALQQSGPHVPAWRDGAPAAGSVVFSWDAPPRASEGAAERSWLNGDAASTVPLNDWLLLRPIPVTEADFNASVEKVGEDGKVQLSTVVVGSSKVSRQSQLSAFDTDWFAGTGPGAVAPREGDSQSVDGRELRWEKVTADGGYVDFRQGFKDPDYSIGYAWTEIVCERDTEAWLGLGSDDGVKIWHNGVLVADKWSRRLSRIDEDIIPLRLKAGSNRLLIKIQNATGDWSLIGRLRVR